jgi:hypothetical protein
MVKRAKTRAPTQRTVLTAAGVAATVLSVAGAIVVTLLVTALSDYRSASSTYIAASESRSELAALLDDAEVTRSDALVEARSALLVAEAVLAAAEDGYVGSAEKAALAARRDSLAATVADADDDPAEGMPARARLPSDATTAQLTEGAAELQAEIARIRAGTARSSGTADEVMAALDRLESSGESFGDALPAVAQAVLDANTSATNDTRIALKSDAQTIDNGSTGWNQLESTVVSFVTSAKAVQASQLSEEAEKSGPLYAARTEIEAYARSIAGGAAIDFDWAPIVIGYGEGGSMAGTSGCSTDPTDDSFYSTITLTNSVASKWGSDSNARALVTHEVGHTITCKCWDLFEANAGGDYEAWATAWAIGMGFEEDGNGTQAYGRPSDTLIDAAKGCR